MTDIGFANGRYPEIKKKSRVERRERCEKLRAAVPAAIFSGRWIGNDEREGAMFSVAEGSAVIFLSKVI